MKSIIYFLSGLYLSFYTSISLASESINIYVKGNVKISHSLNLTEDDHLGKVISSCVYSSNSYLIGAAWIRQTFFEQQVEQRAELLQTLPNLKLSDKLSASLEHQIKNLKATGRIPLKFDWDLIELIPSQNRKLKNKDEFYVPNRPNTIEVVGAVIPQRVVFVPNKSVVDYEKYFKRLSGADQSYVWIIQPDTTIRKVGISYWNADLAYLAPGSIVYVPVSGHDEQLEKFQQSLLELYAVQLLP